MQGMPHWMKWAIALLIGVGIIVLGFRFAGWLLTAFFVLNCLVLIIVVLLQSGKAADLAGAFGGAGSQTAFGPRGAATLLSRATTWCAIMFMICAMALVLRTDSVGTRRFHPAEILEAGPDHQVRAAKTAPAPSTPAPKPQIRRPVHVAPATRRRHRRHRRVSTEKAVARPLYKRFAWSDQATGSCLRPEASAGLS